MAESGPSIVEFSGCRIAYWTEGSGAPVVLVHGTAVPGLAWRPQLDALARRYRCVVFDNRGMAASQPVGARITVDQMALDTIAVMDAAGVESAHVVGHSLGGLVSLQLALGARARVRSLALLCTFARGAVATRITPFMLWAGIRSRIGPRRARRLAFLEMIVPETLRATGDRDALAERLGLVFGHDLADSPAITMKQLAAMSKCDLGSRLGEVSATEDRIAPPAAGRAIADGIPGARHVELANEAHAVPVYASERINTLLLEHLAVAEERA
jgi:pimeloyl-ACP methyl ester carboxylesterase